MQYTSHYRSPIGNILLAADEIGLTGLWFEGQKYFALYLDKEHIEKEIPVLEEAKKWLDIYFTGKIPNLRYRFILREQISKRKSGKSYTPFLTGRQQLMVRSQSSLQRKKENPICQHRQWEERLVIMKFPLSYRATEWSEVTEA